MLQFLTQRSVLALPSCFQQRWRLSPSSIPIVDQTEVLRHLLLGWYTYVGVCSRLVDNLSLSESTVLYVIGSVALELSIYNSLQIIPGPNIETREDMSRMNRLLCWIPVKYRQGKQAHIFIDTLYTPGLRASFTSYIFLSLEKYFSRVTVKLSMSELGRRARGLKNRDFFPAGESCWSIWSLVEPWRKGHRA